MESLEFPEENTRIIMGMSGKGAFFYVASGLMLMVVLLSCGEISGDGAEVMREVDTDHSGEKNKEIIKINSD